MERILCPFLVRSPFDFVRITAWHVDEWEPLIPGEDLVTLEGAGKSFTLVFKEKERGLFLQKQYLPVGAVIQEADTLALVCYEEELISADRPHLIPILGTTKEQWRRDRLLRALKRLIIGFFLLIIGNVVLSNIELINGEVLATLLSLSFGVGALAMAVIACSVMLLNGPGQVLAVRTKNSIPPSPSMEDWIRQPQ